MKEIVVVSGKGGVGKSSLTASLGHLWATAGYRPTLVDADVDAPNLHLALGARATVSEEVKTSEKAAIDAEVCTGCGTCLTVCRFDSLIEGDGGVPLVVRFSCEGCGACAIACPAGAISLRKVGNGRINVYAATDLLVVGGELIIGESSSGMLVDLVKERARREAAASEAEVLLTDGPPGIGCPVIAAVRGADYVVVATEPTPVALHDLGRIVEVVRHFRIPLGIVLNKADLPFAARDTLLGYAAQHQLPLLAEIPYDYTVPRSISAARPVVAAFPEAPASQAIRGLAATLAREVLGSATGASPAGV